MDLEKSKSIFYNIETLQNRNQYIISVQVNLYFKNYLKIKRVRFYTINCSYNQQAYRISSLSNRIRKMINSLSIRKMKSSNRKK